MDIFQNENILTHFNESLKNIEFLTEIYNTREEMSNTNPKKELHIPFSETIENIEKGNKYFVADVDFNDYDISDDFKNLFRFEFDKMNKTNELSLIHISEPTRPY